MKKSFRIKLRPRFQSTEWKWEVWSNPSAQQRLAGMELLRVLATGYASDKALARADAENEARRLTGAEDYVYTPPETP